MTRAITGGYVRNVEDEYLTPSGINEASLLAAQHSSLPGRQWGGSMRKVLAGVL